jgi:hypothetical protein
MTDTANENKPAAPAAQSVQHPPGTVSALRIVLTSGNCIDISYMEAVSALVTGTSIKANGYFCSGAEGVFIPYEKIEGIFVYKPGGSPLEFKPAEKSKLN